MKLKTILSVLALFLTTQFISSQSNIHIPKEIQKAYENLNPQGIEIIAINAGQSREHVLEIKMSYNLTFPLLVDEGAKTAEIYGVTGLPSSFFVDGTGKIREKHIGWLEEEKILEIFKKLQEEG